jgi:hypothetical protein
LKLRAALEKQHTHWVLSVAFRPDGKVPWDVAGQ